MMKRTLFPVNIHEADVLFIESSKLRLELMRTLLEPWCSLRLAETLDSACTTAIWLRPQMLLLSSTYCDTTPLAALDRCAGAAALADVPIFYLLEQQHADVLPAVFSRGACECLLWPAAASELRSRLCQRVHEQQQRHGLITAVHSQDDFLQGLWRSIYGGFTALLDRLDPAEAWHARRVSAFVGVLLQNHACLAGENGAEPQGSEPAITAMACAAALHDIGKLILPPHRQDDHPVAGASLFSEAIAAGGGESAQSFLRYAYAIAADHHERWDGSGFPMHRIKPALPIWVEATALADTYDHLVRDCPQRPALRPQQAIAELCGCGRFLRAGSFRPQLHALVQASADQLEQISQAMGPDSPWDILPQPQLSWQENQKLVSLLTELQRQLGQK